MSHKEIPKCDCSANQGAINFFSKNTTEFNNEEIRFYSQRNYLQRNFEEGMRRLGLQCCVLPSGIQESANIGGS